MPEKVEKKLREQGKKGFVQRKLNEYFDNFLRKAGWPLPDKKKKKKRHKQVAKPGK